MNNREIDALVAEHCMGLLFSSKDQSWVDANGDLFSWGTDPVSFSTDPAASKKLRDKMRADGWYFMLSSERSDFICEWFFPATELSLAGLREAKVTGEIRGATEELAVALAALAAVGKPKPNLTIKHK